MVRGVMAVLSVATIMRSLTGVHCIKHWEAAEDSAYQHHAVLCRWAGLSSELCMSRSEAAQCLAI